MRLFLAAAILLISFAANALSLDEARSTGKVKENSTGYISAIGSAPEVNDLVNDVNQKRRAAYNEISKKNGQPLSVVEKLAGEKLVKEHTK